METSLVQTGQTFFDPEQIDLIKTQIMPGAKDSELKYFVNLCKVKKLDPFSKHIFAVPRKFKDRSGNWQQKWEFQTSIDGFRITAERSKNYEGQEGPFWCGEDGKWVDVWLKKAPPSAAKVGVYKKGFKAPLYGIATWESYVQKKYSGEVNSMWAKMPDVMLAKCAESIALRKAFPEDLSGLYTQDEMAQATEVKDVTPNKEPHALNESKPSTDTMAPVPTVSMSSYEIPFGPFKGMRFNQCEPQDIEDFVTKVYNQAADEGKSIQGVVEKFLILADEYLQSVKKSDETRPLSESTISSQLGSGEDGSQSDGSLPLDDPPPPEPLFPDTEYVKKIASPDEQKEIYKYAEDSGVSREDVDLYVKETFECTMTYLMANNIPKIKEYIEWKKQQK